jgi:hypothetical protein
VGWVARLLNLVVLRVVLDDEALGGGVDELDHAWMFE